MNKKVAQILNYIYMETDVTHEMLKSPIRTQDISDARQAAYYLLKREMNWTASRVGKFLNKTHGAVLHGIDKVNDILESNTNYQNDEFVKNLIQKYKPTAATRFEDSFGYQLRPKLLNPQKLTKTQ